MAIVASLDLTNYLQAASPPTWIGSGRYMENRCAMVYSRSSVDLLRTVDVDELNQSTNCGGVLPRLEADQDSSFRSRDTAKSGPSSDSAAGDSGFSSDSSEETNSSSSSSSTTTRKRVWFADDVGLALVTVCPYDPPPTSTVDHQVPTPRLLCRRRLRLLKPAFRQPWLDVGRLRGRLDRDAVALESVSCRGHGLPLAGTVLVADAAYEKRVTVRCTFDFWSSFVDVAAVHVTRGSRDTDLFAFEVQPAATTVVDDTSPRPGGARVEFAVRYQYRPHSCADWTERWDNNDGRNYQMLTTR